MSRLALQVHQAPPRFQMIQTAQQRGQLSRGFHHVNYVFLRRHLDIYKTKNCYITAVSSKIILHQSILCNFGWFRSMKDCLSLNTKRHMILHTLKNYHNNAICTILHKNNINVRTSPSHVHSYMQCGLK